MKKFLTVLLVIAVMFTFSFGSAFAAAPAKADQLTPEQVEKEITDAADIAKASVLKAKNDALYDIFGSESKITVDGVTVTKATVEKVYDDVIYTPAIAAINNALDKKLQDAHASMNPIDGTIFSGFFTTGSQDATETINGVTYVYPAFSADYSTVTCEVKPGPTATAENWRVLYITASHFKALFNAVNGSASGSYADKIARDAFKTVKSDALTDVRGTDLTVYSTEYKGEAKSNYQIAAELVDKAIKAITDIVIADNASWSDAASAITSIRNIYTPAVNQQRATGYLYDGGNGYNPGLANIEKIADEPTNEAKLEWAKSQVLAKMTEEINKRLAEINKTQDAIILDETLKGEKGSAAAIAKAKDAKEIAQEQAAAALEITTYLVNDAEKLSQLINVATPFSASTVKYANVDGSWFYAQNDGGLRAVGINNGVGYFTAEQQVAIVEHVAKLKVEAEIMKASVTLDDEAAVAIEDELEAQIEKTYKTGTTTNHLSFSDAQMALWARQDALTGNNGKDTVKVNDRKYNTVDYWFSALNNANGKTDNGVYEQKFYDELREVADDTWAAINASKTIAEADEAFLAGYAKFDEILSLADRTAASITKDYADALDKYEKELASYMTYKTDYLNRTNTAKDYSWVSTTMLANLTADLEAAYSVDEIKAAYEAGKAEIDGLKTAAALNAEKDEIIKRVQALPKTITVADKEVVGALKADLDAHNDYCDMIGNTSGKIVMAYAAATNNAYEKIRQLEEAALEAEIKAIGKVTLDDEDAISELSDKIDEYVAYYAGEDAEDNTIDTLYEGVAYNGTDIDDLWGDLEDLKVTDFLAKVGKLPADGSDVAGIKAARAAYADLWRSDRINLYRSSAYDKLLDLEKTLAVSVQALKITASSTAAKGSITVKWTVKGNAAAADGYQIWRSTKKNSGFAKMFTTSKTSYKNTKNLKKGVRYYYKVRAYKTVEGVNIYSDWSNKAYRIAK